MRISAVSLQTLRERKFVWKGWRFLESTENFLLYLRDAEKYNRIRNLEPRKSFRGSGESRFQGIAEISRKGSIGHERFFRRKLGWVVPQNPQ